MHSPILSISHVSFAYEGKKRVLDDISVDIVSGGFYALCGANGSGKSTFSLLLNGLIPHFIKGTLHGEVQINGVKSTQKDVAFFARTVGIVFQNPDFSLFNLTVREEIAFGMKNFGLDTTQGHIQNALSLVGMTDFIDRDPQTLSVGEKQKVALACVIALDTPVIVMDEPIAQIDYRGSLEIYRILEQLHGHGKTILVIEHDTDFVWRFIEKTIILKDGRIMKNGLTRTVLADAAFLHTIGLKPPHRSAFNRL